MIKDCSALLWLGPIAVWIACLCACAFLYADWRDACAPCARPPSGVGVVVALSKRDIQCGNTTVTECERIEDIYSGIGLIALAPLLWLCIMWATMQWRKTLTTGEKK